jgi:hypothetical protein
MDTETARWVLYAITAIGFVVWLAAMQFVVASVKAENEATRAALEAFGFDEPSVGRLVVGRAEIEGQPAALAAKAASALANPWQNQLGPIKILARSEDRVSFEGAGHAAVGQAGWRGLGRGTMQFTRRGPNHTAVAYAVELRGGRWMLLMARLFLILGLAALVAGCGLILAFVVPHPNPAVRAQAVQMVQAVHFLWPPFLFAGLYRSTARAVRVSLEVLVHNLPFSSEVS